MGIRNLAYCVIDRLSESTPSSKPGKPGTPSYRIGTWTRLDLLTPPITNATASPVDPESIRGSSKSPLDQAPRKPPTLPQFTPSSLSRTAYNLTSTLLSHHPDTILIERQRFRSSGGPAIQEWTLRVNMLESMLWAGLETRRQLLLEPAESNADASLDSSPNFPTIIEANPARIARFWLAGPGVPLRVPEDLFQTVTSTSASTSPPAALPESATRKQKIDKRDKIALARLWLAGGEEAEVKVEFEGGVGGVVGRFLGATSATSSSPSPSSRRRKIRFENGDVGGSADGSDGGNHSGGPVQAAGKLDDLADCLLQGMAWLRWRENATRMAQLLRQWQSTDSGSRAEEKKKAEKKVKPEKSVGKRKGRAR